MRPKPMSRRLTVEALEPRQTPSALPINTIGVAQGSVPAPGAVAQVSVPIAPDYFAAGRHTTLFTVTVAPTPASPLNPKVLATLGPGGETLPLMHGAPFVPVKHPQAMTFFVDAQPGNQSTLVTGRHATTGGFTARTALPGDANGDGHVDIQDLEAYVKAFLTTSHDAFYKPSADANQNGIVGQGDAIILERNLTPLTPKRPISVRLHLAPGEEVLHPHVHNSGGVTRTADITILGKTTPGSIVFADDQLGNYSFSGAALATDAQGNFVQHFHLKDQLTNFEYLVIDPYGQRTIRAFPVLLLTS